jgi:hypothetical protein
MSQHQLRAQASSFLSPEEKAHRGLQFLRDAFRSIVEQKQTLLQSEQNVLSLIPERITGTIQDQFLGTDEKIPELRVNGKWLLDVGFHFDQKVSIFIVQSMLVICPEAALIDQMSKAEE